MINIIHIIQQKNGLVNKDINKSINDCQLTILKELVGVVDNDNT